jgi:hypothetical protein
MEVDMKLTILTEDGELELLQDPSEAEIVLDTDDEVITTELYDGFYTEYLDDEDEVGVQARRTSRSFKLASASGPPDFKTEMERQRIGPRWARTYIRVPVLYRRNTTYVAYARISSGHITNEQVWNAVRSCVAGAVVSAGIAAAVASAASGGAGIAAAKPAFMSVVTGCLAARGGQFVQIAADVRVDLYVEKESGPWRRSS